MFSAGLLSVLVGLVFSTGLFSLSVFAGLFSDGPTGTSGISDGFTEISGLSERGLIMTSLPPILETTTFLLSFSPLITASVSLSSLSSFVFEFDFFPKNIPADKAVAPIKTTITPFLIITFILLEIFPVELGPKIGVPFSILFILFPPLLRARSAFLSVFSCFLRVFSASFSALFCSLRACLASFSAFFCSL